MTVDCFLAKLTGSTFVGVCFVEVVNFGLQAIKEKEAYQKRLFGIFNFFVSFSFVWALPEKVSTVEFLVWY